MYFILHNIYLYYNGKDTIKEITNKYTEKETTDYIFITSKLEKYKHICICCPCSYYPFTIIKFSIIHIINDTGNFLNISIPLSNLLFLLNGHNNCGFLSKYRFVLKKTRCTNSFIENLRIILYNYLIISNPTEESRDIFPKKVIKKLYYIIVGLFETKFIGDIRDIRDIGNDEDIRYIEDDKDIGDDEDIEDDEEMKRFKANLFSKMVGG